MRRITLPAPDIERAGEALWRACVAHVLLDTFPGAPAGSDFTIRALEPEIAFRLAVDLPPRDTPYSVAQVAAAVASAHPAL